MEKRLNKEFLFREAEQFSDLSETQMVQLRKVDSELFCTPPLLIRNQVDEISIIYGIEHNTTRVSFESSKDFIIFPLLRKAEYFYKFLIYRAEKSEYLDRVESYQKEYTAYLEERIESLRSSKTFQDNSIPIKKTAIDYERAISIYQKRVPVLMAPLFYDQEEYEIILLIKKRGNNVPRKRDKNGAYNNKSYTVDSDSHYRIYSKFTAQMIADSKWDKLIAYINYHGMIIPVPIIYLIPSKLKMI